MNYIPNLTQKSLFELASSGDFQAISQWINKKLKPQGISARIAKENTGYLEVLVEFQTQPPVDRLIKFICYQLSQLNYPTLEKVKIVGRLSGSPNILWKHSVRINSHAKKNFNKQSNFVNKSDNLQFQTFRYLILLSSAVAAFIIGILVSYYSVLVRNSTSGQWVETAIEKVRVVEHRKVQNSQDPMVTLMFGGDVNLSNQVSNLVKRDYKLPFAKMNEYRAADLSIVNLESPLTRSTLNSRTQQQKSTVNPSYVKALTSGGVDLVNLANDHTLGYEQKSLLETIETLENAGIHSLGAGKTEEEARRPKIFEVKGQKIAYLNYYDTDIQPTTESVYVNSRNKDRLSSDIQILKKQVDWIIVNYHWGVQLSEYPGDWQMNIARMTIDQGADLVVGHHPKVLQGAEIYRGRPIIYSLGNFIFGDTSNKESDYDTAVLKVSLKPGKMKIEFLPVVVSKYQPHIVKGEKGKEILKHIAQISSIFHQPMRTPIIINTINDDFNFVGIDSFPREENSKTFSTPILPELPLKSPQADPNPTSSSHNNSEQEASNNNNSFSLPPILSPAPTPKERIDPFIKKPFIKEPFIELPRLQI
ncbi:Putative enzyme of poly-gamma-glutamate biosynthesis (capsule formation)-like [Trichodesmium erythraeum IMS101]|uniref:Putative enzyme of poly-gamma-glutamate biosynthesis (Capsule formation)-like n=1 Tax=Trichodesmium erythraeum (strain IMS101) TaxID=203124 RepID=Q10XB5_TRIEI|nr:CapA family protein [Trichodesmium erythraeum GBRTRLIN201]MDE5092938.1 CapA family protein [Trichodesmium sp. St11_bin5]